MNRAQAGALNRGRREAPTIPQFSCNPGRATLVRVVGDGLRSFGLYTHAEAVIAEGTPERLRAAGRAVLDVEAAFATAKIEDWAGAAASLAKLIREALL